MTPTPTCGPGAARPSPGIAAEVLRRDEHGAANPRDGIVVVARVGTGTGGNLEVETGGVEDSPGVEAERAGGDRGVGVGLEIGTEKGREVGNIQQMTS